MTEYQIVEAFLHIVPMGIILATVYAIVIIAVKGRNYK